MASIKDALTEVGSLFGAGQSAIQQTQAQVSGDIEEVKQVAEGYAAATLALQAISTLAVSVLAYCAWTNFCSKRR